MRLSAAADCDCTCTVGYIWLLGLLPQTFHGAPALSPVAARRSVAHGANIRLAPGVLADYRIPGAPLPSVGLGRISDLKCIWCILNVTEHLWWTDIARCIAFKCAHKPIFYHP